MHCIGAQNNPKYEHFFVNVRFIVVVMKLRAAIAKKKNLALTRAMKVSYVIRHEQASSLVLFHNYDV
jgi:hypothetical protein